MSLDEVAASVTSRAAAIGASAELGSLAPGMICDAVVMDLGDGTSPPWTGPGTR